MMSLTIFLFNILYLHLFFNVLGDFFLPKMLNSFFIFSAFDPTSRESSGGFKLSSRKAFSPHFYSW